MSLPAGVVLGVHLVTELRKSVASVDRAQHRQAPEAAVGKDSLVENVACVKRRTARSKPFGASGRSATRAFIGRQFQ
jgi:hypothetical protein